MIFVRLDATEPGVISAWQSRLPNLMTVDNRVRTGLFPGHFTRLRFARLEFGAGAELCWAWPQRPQPDIRLSECAPEPLAHV
jgi:hypothetical protein